MIHLTGATRASPPASPGWVLDTQVVLDWLVFGNPDGRRLGAAIEAGRAQWWATGPMRAEFDRVTRSKANAHFPFDADRCALAWERHALTPAGSVGQPSVAATPRCRDPDDQMFLDLACASGAAWLVTRDRALLDLRRRVTRYDLLILTPAQTAAYLLDSQTS